jgi:hypothetical protein
VTRTVNVISQSARYAGTPTPLCSTGGAGRLAAARARRILTLIQNGTLPRYSSACASQLQPTPGRVLRGLEADCVPVISKGIALSLCYSEGHLVSPVGVVFQVGMNQVVKQAYFGELPCTSRIRESVCRIAAIDICHILGCDLTAVSLQLQANIRFSYLGAPNSRLTPLSESGICPKVLDAHHASGPVHFPEKYFCMGSQ